MNKNDDFNTDVDVLVFIFSNTVLYILNNYISHELARAVILFGWSLKLKNSIPYSYIKEKNNN